MNQPKRRGRPPKIQLVPASPSDDAIEKMLDPLAVAFDDPLQVMHDNAVELDLPNEPWEWPKSPSEPLMVNEYGSDSPVEFEPPHMMPWGQFAEYVRSHAPKVVRASYPLPATDVIDTIYSGVPVIHGEPAVMDAQSNWTPVSGD